jgi:hypothetical protein
LFLSRTKFQTMIASFFAIILFVFGYNVGSYEPLGFFSMLISISTVFISFGLLFQAYYVFKKTKK